LRAGDVSPPHADVIRIHLVLCFSGSRPEKNMKRILLVALLCLTTTATLAKEPAPLTDAGIRQAMIQESIASYPGRCPCPYNSAKNGSSCGGRSAYSRPSGHAPLCYPKDVSAEMVRRYRGQHR
jgi:hypothetical protein